MRPRFVVAGGIGAAALVAAIVVGTQPASGEAEHADPPQEVAETPSPATAGAPVVPGLAETELHPAPEVWPALVGELLQRWSDCVSARDRTDATRDLDGEEVSTAAECAAAVVHEGSAAASLIGADDPRHDLVRDWLRAEGEVVVVERMGAAVLLDLVADTTTTASLLVVRSEAGWRIRDVIG